MIIVQLQKEMKKIIDSSMLVKIISMFLAISMLAACKSVNDNSIGQNDSSSVTSSGNQSQDNLSSSKESSSSEDIDPSADNNSSFEFDFNDNTEDYIEETVDYSVNKSFCPKGYKKVWEDEFNGNKLDPKKWMFLDGMGSKPDMYSLTSEDVVRVEDGLLKMEALHYFDPYGDPTVPFATNVSLTTAGTMNFKYGYLEMCAKLSFKNGTWPSWWLKGVNEKRYQDNFDKFLAKTDIKYMPEVDIFENFGTVDTLTFNLHKWNIKSGNDFYHTSLDGYNFNRSYTFENSFNLENEFHVYAFEWTPDFMAVYVDGEKYFSYDLKKNFDSNGQNTGMDCFHVPMYIVFNNYLYTPEGGYSETVINPSDLPTIFHIDWIKLYQKSDIGELYVTK